MSVKDLLSQDEIDALLHGVDDGDVETADEGVAVELGGGVERYDLASQERIVRGRMPTLEQINERFARACRLSFFNLIRRSVDVAPTGIQVMKYSDYLSTLYLPTSMNLIQMAPLPGTAMLIFDAKMVYRMVDHFFGGDGRHAKIEGREFTSTEMRIVGRLLQQAFADLKDSWKIAADIDCRQIGSEMNPAFANIVSASEIVVVSSFEVDMEGGAGEMHLTLPYTMLEPIREIIHNGVHDRRGVQDEAWRRAISRDLVTAPVGISLKVLEREMTLRDVLAFEAGDVIPVEMPEYTVLEANGIPLYNCQLGVAHGNLAFKVAAQLSRDTDS